MKTGLPNQSRRAFLATAGIGASVSMFAMDAHSEDMGGNPELGSLAAVLTGTGAWTFEVVPGWGALPAGTARK